MSLKRYWVAFVVVFSATLLAASPLSSGADAQPSESTSGVAAAQPAGNDSTHATSPVEQSPVASQPLQIVGSTPGCIVDQTVLSDVQNRMAEIDRREKAAAARETELNARENALNEELAKIAGVRDEIARIEELRKKEGQEKVTKLVETLQGMSPKAAAQLISTIDEVLAVAAMSQIATPKLSKIMNVMEPDKSARLSEILAGVTRAKGGWKQPPTSSNGGAAVTTDVIASGKMRGGEKQ